VIGGVYFEEHGPREAPPLFLSAGLGGSGAYWAPNLAALAERHRVILYDHRGTGGSDRVLPGSLTVDDMADDVIALMDGLDLPSAALVGHAAGGVIGLSLALRYPERLDRLVVVNGWSAPDPHFRRCMEARLTLLEHSVTAFVRAQPIFLYPARWASANSAALDAQAAAQLEHFQGEENVRLRIAALSAFDIDARLGEIGAPVLLVAAEDDILVPASCSERLAAGLPNATLAPMTGGHACNVSEPDRFDSILRDWVANT
jgi:aminoacrylate hydrolase